jgi:3-oxoacyl-[acyl-carrier protein] reductase
MGLLQERVAVVTGAGRGIGQAIAELFVAEGAHVVINDVDLEPALEVAARCNQILAGAAVVSVGSVVDPKYTDELMRAALEAFGALDVLVNNAGVTRDRMSHKMTDADWDLVMDVNLRGTFNCIRSAAPHMREVAKQELEQHGEVARVRKIVNFFSTAAIRGNPGQANYAAAKMGNVGLTRVIAQEWGRYRVCVNAVAPGFTETRMTATKQRGGDVGIPEAQRAATLERIPFGRFGTPTDVARVALFLSSPLSDYVTGQEINVSGGLQIP